MLEESEDSMPMNISVPSLSVILKEGTLLETKEPLYDTQLELPLVSSYGVLYRSPILISVS